jgi:ComF family protein
MIDSVRRADDHGPPQPAGRALATRARRLLAPRCLLCDTARGDPLCTPCAHDFFPTVPRCVTCGLRLGAAAGRCGACLRAPPAFDATVALADYAPPIDGLIIGLKFGHRLDIAAALGRLLAEPLATRTAPDAWVIPVPLAFERQRSRGFNQALEIARVAARLAGRRLLAGALLRAHHRAPQESLTLAQRRGNVRGAFVVPEAARATLAGREVVVVDDVMTTGSTLDEIARLLRDAGAAHIVNAVVARTP